MESEPLNSHPGLGTVRTRFLPMNSLLLGSWAPPAALHWRGNQWAGGCPKARSAVPAQSLRKPHTLQLGGGAARLALSCEQRPAPTGPSQWGEVGQRPWALPRGGGHPWGCSGGCGYNGEIKCGLRKQTGPAGIPAPHVGAVWRWARCLNIFEPLFPLIKKPSLPMAVRLLRCSVRGSASPSPG